MEKTTGGTKIGTYNYMAPEVYNNQPYGHPADIYSLGLVLYWFLNERRLPFCPMPPQLPKSSDLEEARARRFNGETIPAPLHGSPALKQIVLKACAYDPKTRYQTAEEMLSDLNQLPLASDRRAGNAHITARSKAAETAQKLQASHPAVETGVDGTVGMFGQRKAAEPAPVTATIQPVSEIEVDGTLGMFGRHKPGAPVPETSAVPPVSEIEEDGTVGMFGQRKAAEPAAVQPASEIEADGTAGISGRREAAESGPEPAVVQSVSEIETDGTVGMFGRSKAVGPASEHAAVLSGSEIEENGTVGMFARHKAENSALETEAASDRPTPEIGADAPVDTTSSLDKYKAEPVSPPTEHAAEPTSHPSEKQSESQSKSEVKDNTPSVNETESADTVSDKGSASQGEGAKQQSGKSKKGLWFGIGGALIAACVAIILLFSGKNTPSAPTTQAATAVPTVTNAPVVTATPEPVQSQTPQTTSDTTTWSWTVKDGVLTISGSGDMPDYSGRLNVPWYSQSDEIVSIVVEEGITGIGDFAFGTCGKATSASIASSVVRIGKNAFSSCEKLRTVQIPDSVQEIGTEAFRQCSALTKVRLPSGITEISDRLFCDCRGLTSVWFPKGIVRIGSEAFRECDQLQVVAIPDGVTDIGANAFYDCDKLTSVIIPSSVQIIWDNAFSECDSLKRVDIPFGVTILKGYSFSGCDALTTVSLPSSLISIDEGAFNVCGSLSEVHYLGDQSQFSSLWVGPVNDWLLNATSTYEPLYFYEKLVNINYDYENRDLPGGDPEVQFLGKQITVSWDEYADFPTSRITVVNPNDVYVRIGEETSDITEDERFTATWNGAQAVIEATEQLSPGAYELRLMTEEKTCVRIWFCYGASGCEFVIKTNIWWQGTTLTSFSAFRSSSGYEIATDGEQFFLGQWQEGTKSTRDNDASVDTIVFDGRYYMRVNARKNEPVPVTDPEEAADIQLVWVYYIDETYMERHDDPNTESAFEVFYIICDGQYLCADDSGHLYFSPEKTENALWRI